MRLVLVLIMMTMHKKCKPIATLTGPGFNRRWANKKGDAGVSVRSDKKQSIACSMLTLNPHPFTDLLKLSNLACAKCFGQMTVESRCLSCK